MPDTSLHDALAIALQHHRSGNPAAAIPLYEHFLATHPAHDPTHYNLALAHLQLGRPAAAIPHFQRVIELAPHYLLAHANLGYALLLVDRLDEAIVSLTAAIALDPAVSKIHLHLGHAHKARAELPEALAAYRRAIALDPADPAPQSSLLYTLYYHEDSTPESIHAEHAAWAREPVALAPAHVRNPLPSARLRLAYLGANFNNHCQSLFTLPLLKNHDRTQFEITLYSNTVRPDPITDQLRQHTDHFHDITPLTDAQLAQKIREDRIDILVDLTMHMADNRLRALAQRPAPLQITWLAYPGTTGLPQIDHRFTDLYLDPPEKKPAVCDIAGPSARIYSETSLHLPHTFWCYDPLATEPLVNELPALESGGGGRGANGEISFGCLNNFCKITPPTLRLWSSVLHTLPNSRLHLLAPEGSARDRIAQTLNIDPARITFHSRRPRPDYLALYHQIDIALDTVPYNGHTTSLDAFWMGVPVITLAGATAVARAGLSQLTNLDLQELVAHTADEFVQIATTLAIDLPRLAQLRATLRQRMESSPLMNAPLFARNIEALYRRAWQFSIQ